MRSLITARKVIRNIYPLYFTIGCPHVPSQCAKKESNVQRQRWCEEWKSDECKKWYREFCDGLERAVTPRDEHFSQIGIGECRNWREWSRMESDILPTQPYLKRGTWQRQLGRESNRYWQRQLVTVSEAHCQVEIQDLKESKCAANTFNGEHKLQYKFFLCNI